MAGCFVCVLLYTDSVCVCVCVCVRAVVVVVIWCFTPSQPLRLSQGITHFVDTQ